MPVLTIVIPVRDKWELTAACLRSLAEHTPGEDFAVQVVDNASDDDTATACPALGAALFGRRFGYQRFERNRNFGPACNAGASVADSDLLFFLNNDTLVTRGWLPPLLDALAGDPTLAGVGPLLLYPDDTVQHLGIAIAPAGEAMAHLYSGLACAHPLARHRRRFPAITGAALMVYRRQFLEAGGFWEEYVNGFEDVDLCLTLTGRGAAMSVIPESRVVHLESQTPKRHDREKHNSRLLRTRHDLSRFVNMPALAAEDGYTLRVDVDLHVRFAVPEERQRDLLRRLRAVCPFSPVRCRALLEEEPFWEEGYDLLATCLENSGRWGDALAVWHRALRIAPTLAAAERTLRALRACGAEPGSLAGTVQDWRAGILDEAGYISKYTAILALLRRDGPAFLIPAYEQAAGRAAELRARWRSEGNGVAAD